MDVNHKDMVILVEEIHQYMHDNLYNQLMEELENLVQDKVHHQTEEEEKRINISIKNLKFLPFVDSYILQDMFYINDDPNHQLYDHHT